ncbi:hypothetical protein K9L16_02220 [Candidatus Pacearchaeota archaeon]|nr:hypothetical protein [Candidatus Pacearchaeota archaeon]
MLKSSEIEKFIQEYQPAVVRYLADHHQGFDHENPNCVGIINEGDIYLVFASDFQFQKICVESETRSQKFPGSEDRYLGIFKVDIVKNPRSKREKLAQKVLESIQKRTQLTKYPIYWTKSVNGFGVNKELKFWFKS